MPHDLVPPSAEVIARAVALALEEDRAAQDVTTLATVSPMLQGRAVFVAKEAGVAAGLVVAAEAFRQADAAIAFRQAFAEGERFGPGVEIGVAEGPVRGLLQAERTALNFVQRLCATAALTRQFVDAVTGTGAVILDTRKTTPGLRDLEKYAVRCGGGTNHRRDLESMAMIKDNHREALAREGRSLADGIGAIRAARRGVAIEVEVDDSRQLDEALAGRPEWILLDNMTPATMREAVRHIGGRARVEASGGVTLATVRAIAETGVDAISVGALTHSAGSLDIGLDLTF